MAPKGAAFYAVKAGRTPGIYNTWAECQRMINGYSGAVFKKFSTHAEATAFVEGKVPAKSSSSSSSTSGSSGSASTGNARAGTKRSASAADLPSRNASEGSTAQSATGASRKRVIVYCDGASSSNGQKNARAGWGVWFEDPQNQHLNEARRLPGPIQTNNRAELTAIWRACQLCPDPAAQLVIYTDSQYCVQAINDWQAGWRRRGWKLSSGGPVLNKDLIRRIERAFRARSLRPQLIHVRGHAGVHGNEQADRLAVQGATLPDTSASEELSELSDSDDDQASQGAGSSKRVKRS